MKHLDREFKDYLINTIELSDSDIKVFSSNEIFEEILNYNGYIHCADEIKRWILQIYKIDLDEISKEAWLHE